MATREIAVTLWPWLILIVLYGACVGSFLNVVIYRLPSGLSLVRPRSHCPHCSRDLAWYENIPLVSWFMLRARCRTCTSPISSQYPLVEGGCAALFGVTSWIYYGTALRPQFVTAGLDITWPVLLVHLVLIAALLAASVIDLKLFIIPLDIPNLVTLLAVVALPCAATFVPETSTVAPAVGPSATAAAVGAILGLGLAYHLLRKGVLPQSFWVEAEQGEMECQGGQDTPEQWLAHPHPRREVMKELLYVVWPLVGAAVGVGGHAVFFRDTGIPWPTGVTVLGGVLLGYLVGGGLIWSIRIIGTLVFGKEAMGLGDVHVLAAIGAVFGWSDALVVFFLAPFAGLAGSVVVAGLGKLLKGQVRAIPYGPYLAAAAIAWAWWQVPLRQAYVTLFLPIP